MKKAETVYINDFSLSEDGPSGETWKLENASRIIAHHVISPCFSTISRFQHILIFAYIYTSFHKNKDQIRTRKPPIFLSVILNYYITLSGPNQEKHNTFQTDFLQYNICNVCLFVPKICVYIIFTTCLFDLDNFLCYNKNS